MVLVWGFGKDVCLVNGLSPMMITMKFLSLKEIECYHDTTAVNNVYAYFHFCLLSCICVSLVVYPPQP